MYEGNPGEIDFGSSKGEVRVTVARVRVIGSRLYIYSLHGVMINVFSFTIRQTIAHNCSVE